MPNNFTLNPFNPIPNSPPQIQPEPVTSSAGLVASYNTLQGPPLREPCPFSIGDEIVCTSGYWKNSEFVIEDIDRHYSSMLVRLTKYGDAIIKDSQENDEDLPPLGYKTYKYPKNFELCLMKYDPTQQEDDENCI